MEGKPPSAAPASSLQHTPIHIPAAPLPVLLCLYKTVEHGHSVWDPTTHVRGLEEAPFSWLRPHLALGTAAIEGRNLSLCVFQINK